MGAYRYIFVLLFLSLPAAATDGSFITTVAARCLTAYHYLAVGSARKHDGRRVVSRDESGDTIDITVGPKLGAGMAGIVYPVVSVNGGNLNGLSGTPEVVVKLPHRLKLFGAANPLSAYMQSTEVRIYDGMYDSLPRIEKDSHFPSKPAWETGKLPVLPILEKKRTHQGLFLFKPLIRGKELKQLQKELGFTKVEELPAEMRASLIEIYQLTQATFNEGKMKEGNGVATISLDLNPANLVWIDDPVTMASIGLKRPSFIFFEMGVFPGHYFHRKNISQYAYLNLVVQKSVEYNKGE